MKHGNSFGQRNLPRTRNEIVEAQKPITCVDLMDDPDFRATAIAEYGKDIRVTTNKVSDALGLMWRRNLLVRYPAPRETSSLARYAYI